MMGFHFFLANDQSTGLSRKANEIYLLEREWDSGAFKKGGV